MSEQNQTGLSSELKDEFYNVRSELQQFWFMRGGLQYVLGALLALSAFGLVDYFMPLPMVARVGVILTLLLVGFVGLVRWLKNRDSIDDLTAAKEIEKANPQFGQRLRTAHQFEENALDRTPQLTTALISETNVLVSQGAIESPVPWLGLRSWILGIATVAAILLGVLAYFGESRVTLARMFCIPVHYSNLAVTEMEPVVAGSNATFTAVATGRPLKSVELWTRDPEAKEWQKVAMLPKSVASDAEELPKNFKGELTATIEDCDSDMLYMVVASPLPISNGKLTVLQPLEQQSFAATVDPPAYTRTEKQTVEEMELTVVEGSMVAWELNLNREPAKAKLVSTDSKNKGPLPPIKIEGSKLVCDLAQLEETTSYEVQAESADGMKFNSDRIRIRVKKDRGPTVAFQKPKDELEVTPTTEVGLNVRIQDDFGLGKVGIEYQINGGERKTLWEQNLAGQKKEYTTMPVMYLEEHALSHEDAITYYAFAEDHRDEPKRTRSELQFIDIRPYKREFQVVDSNCQGSGSCDSLTLAELIKRQRHTLRRTFANLDRQPIQDSLSKRLATSQQEIQAATQEFTAGWEMKFGPMPMLHDAVKTMAKATEQLEQKALDPAMPLEESALADLIKAKQNARKYLKNCKSSGGFSQCKNFDTAMAQRIRQPKRKDDEAAKSVAQARQQLQEMAEKQKRFSEEVAAANGGAKLDKRPNASPKSSSKSGSQASGKSGQGQRGSQSAKQAQNLAQSQQSAAQKAQQMREAMQQNEIASELAQQRMDEATEQIEQSAREMQQGDKMAAAEHARQAAEMLEQLDEHLQGLSEPDLGKRLAIAEQMATRLSSAESNVAKSLDGEEETSSDKDEKTKSLADTQKRLADQAETLADLVRHLEADALGDNMELRQGLGDLQSEQDPEELANDMQQVARQIGKQNGKAASGAQGAANDMGQVASALGALRRSAMQPQLEELMAAEAKTAELLRAIQASQTQSELTKQYENLQDKLADLNVSTKEATASAAVQPSVGSKGGGVGSAGGPTSGTEFFYAGRARNAELRQILNVLQSKIQDAILLTARMDADEPVPAKYRELVSEYYQTLSDDLR